MKMAENNMEITKIKLHKALTCTEEEKVLDVAKKLKDANDRRIFVVDSEGNLKGVITTTDLAYKAVAEDASNLTAKDIMVSDVKAVDSSEDLNKALEIMNNLKSFACPVVDKGKLSGVIFYHDIVNYVMEQLKNA